MKKYIWQQAQWPQFYWKSERLIEPLKDVREIQAQFLSKISDLTDDLKRVSQVESMTDELCDSNKIEGEFLDRESVRSSLLNRLGVTKEKLAVNDRSVDGIVKALIDALRDPKARLTQNQILSWHAVLFPTGFSGLQKINAGKWRNEGMEIVSGDIGRRKVYYVAPSASQLKKEVQVFLQWFNGPSHQIDGLIRAGITHLWFVMIHPFDDGNGRITRILTERALCLDEGLKVRYYSLSSHILKNRKDYYAVLERVGKGSLDITSWLLWFLDCLKGAILDSEKILKHVFLKSKFWDRCQKYELNDRQKKVLTKMLEWEKGVLTTRKYLSIVKNLSRITAIRDINDLVDKKILRQNKSQGRSVSYSIVLK